MGEEWSGSGGNGGIVVIKVVMVVAASWIGEVYSAVTRSVASHHVWRTSLFTRTKSLSDISFLFSEPANLSPSFIF